MSGSTVGERLRIAREAQGLDVEDIASRTRIPTRHLRMIERGDYAGLPAPTYSAGFIKTYARLLGLDGRELSDQFRTEIGTATVESHKPQPYEPADPRRTPPIGLALLALLVAMVVGLGYLYWRGARDEPVEVAAQASDAPAAAPNRAQPAAQPMAPTPAPTGGPVAIGANQDVWVRVSDGGKTLFMGTLKPGNRFDVPADAVDPLLTTGRPGSTTITVGQTPIPSVGDPDRAAKNVSLKADALLARVATPPPATQPAAGAATPVENGAGPA
ncbi:helix-turn-helix domain-containing protein [uncultured Sphingomonas sp.]|uniref:helix-turn-helix domain-containing protein n=1 Tax=uncultured Sphingomonas sp. TaxID=158754 RepID=UPI0025FDA897|nr:helix-turn-helix domain-containing protein [uncultured Sphingomonas sp.]